VAYQAQNVIDIAVFMLGL